ncbi:MAG: hypothetical protein EOO15_00415 [Chitinophagaceae bacterium]|nr:MAG: hypothetical protein EOO15_00415 [Chitinophagaceae bacterium]
MPPLNYTRRLENLRDRRFDKELNESLLTKTFSAGTLPEDLRYLAESMQPIDQKYNQKTLTAAENVMNHLKKGLDLPFGLAYKYQGSVMTSTNIKTHSDIDLLTVINNYSYIQKTPVPNPYEGDPNSDIINLRTKALNLLKGIYVDVDDKGAKSITIVNKSLKRTVDIVPSFWYNSDKYYETNDEFYRGVHLFDFVKKHKLKADYPFAHIKNVQNRGNLTNDGFRKAVRLLKTLKADADSEVNISSFQITSLVYSMPAADVSYTPGAELTIAENVSKFITKMLDDQAFRNSIQNPNKTEYPFENSDTVPHLRSLREDLDQLIADCKSELKNANFDRAFKNYL